MTDTNEITLWAVYTNTDLTEGRGREYVKHFCQFEATARRLARKGYVQGSDCPVRTVKAISIDGRHFLPSSLINIEPPTAEDNAAEVRLMKYRDALEKAKASGLSDEDIEIIVKGVKP